MKKTKTSKIGFVAGTALLGLLAGCVAHVDGPRGEVDAPPSSVYVETGVAAQDDYVYYPAYQVYYSGARHQYVYQDGSSWVSRSAPPRALPTASGSSLPGWLMVYSQATNEAAGHLADRAGFVVVSPDSPKAQQKFAKSRGWRFPMASGQGSTFTEDMGFKSDDGWMPGVSTFQRKAGKTAGSNRKPSRRASPTGRGARAG